MQDTRQDVAESFLAVVQQACLPGVWSKGVAASRDGTIVEDRAGAGELIVRVVMPGRPVHPRVTLWPEEEDWHCDCGDRNDPCLHVAAAAIALKSGLIQARGSEPASVAGVSYRLLRHEGGLALERSVRSAGRETRLSETLVSFVGGIRSGRIAHPSVAAAREDFAIDELLGGQGASRLDRPGWARLLALLESCASLTLDGKSVRASKLPVEHQAELVDEGEGFRLRRKPDPTLTEVFTPGIALCGETLRPVLDPGLTASELALLRGEGRFFAREDGGTLVGEILPQLRARIPVHVAASRLPSLASAAPLIRLRIENDGPDRVRALAELVYGDPPIACVRTDLPGTPLQALDPAQVPARDPAAEKRLARELQDELHLPIGQLARFEGELALDFLSRARRSAGAERLIEDAEQARLAEAPLRPRIRITESGGPELALSFESQGHSLAADEVLRHWREGRRAMPLPLGGWAPLPLDWLERYGERILRLLDSRDGSKRLVACRLPEALSLCAENGDEVPAALARLHEALESFERIPEAILPPDLRATPRSYQRRGIDWLCFLREHGMGALLADDMGLGKTLQALCAIRGRTLIVCPTSVLASWAEQIGRFRPGLRQALYHGPDRAIPADSDITLTTYGILRQDRELLTAERWTTIVLDEAHLIKNPDSQIARAAHALSADFRIALSGTPVENRLEDLWSQFQFVNPGLLGSRESFAADFSVPEAEARLRARIRPFLLRRLKREVAPELPPRTEVTLHCELEGPERELYDSVLAASRAEVLSTLDRGGTVFAILESLLRLRQACCHPALVPGQTAVSPRHSSKTRLLLDTLEESIGLGHRSLVFSQWTSCLDLLEPLLNEAGIAFLRLDGTTSDRGRVVEDFQDPLGPPVLLLSLKAGGVGLTLTAADHVFLLDPWWNPAVEEQAADRAHRIGQVNPVLVHRLVARGTIEERVLDLQREKARLSDSILEGTSDASRLTREDWLSMLG